MLSPNDVEMQVFEREETKARRLMRAAVEENKEERGTLVR